MSSSENPDRSIEENLAAVDRLIGQAKWRKTRGRAFNPPTKPIVTTPTRPPGKVLPLVRSTT